MRIDEKNQQNAGKPNQEAFMKDYTAWQMGIITGV